MQEKPQIWDGKAVKVSTPSQANGKRWSKPIAINLTEEAARRLSWGLAMLAQYHKERNPNAEQHLVLEVQELLDALNYTLIGDPRSRAKYVAMMEGRLSSILATNDVAKGMTPDGGYRAPEGKTWLDNQAAEDATLAQMKERTE